MKRTIVIGDIHGCYDKLIELIGKIGYDKNNDKLIFTGDLIDRGKDSFHVVKYLRKLQNENEGNVIILKGNHEDMAVESMTQLDMPIRQNWMTYNGGNKTIKSYKKNKSNIHNDIEWMNNLPLYYEDDNYYYVHAGFNMKYGIENQDIYDMLWIREDFIFNDKRMNKPVIFGHTPTAVLKIKPTPYMTVAGNIGIDTGCFFTGILTALIINNGEVDGFIQTEPYEIIDSLETV